MLGKQKSVYRTIWSAVVQGITVVQGIVTVPGVVGRPAALCSAGPGLLLTTAPGLANRLNPPKAAEKLNHKLLS